MRVLAFGTYDATTHPRVQVLIDGLREHGIAVVELDEPLGLSTAERVAILRHPWRLPILVGRLLNRWLRLVTGSRRHRGRHRPDALLVGYLGHFDVLLARLLFPRTTIVLDHLIFAADTAADRGASPGLHTRLLARLDRLAIAAADVVVVDTPEHHAMVPAARAGDAVVVPVGAPAPWFEAEASPVRPDEPPSAVFFGLFTPLQGAPTIGLALRLLAERGVNLRATLIGSGQDADAVHHEVNGLAQVQWLPWVPAAELPAVVARHDICLGIFGTTEKAARVVPNKVYQGAAAGTAIVTSDTTPQRQCLDSAAVLVPPGDPAALADALTHLATDPEHLATMRKRARDLARRAFTAASVTAPLVAALETRTGRR